MLDINSLLGFQGKTAQASQVKVIGGNGHGGVNTVNRKFTTVVSNIGECITYQIGTANGDTFTINRPGIYGIIYYDVRNAAPAVFGITCNNNDPTTGVSSLTYPAVIAISGSQTSVVGTVQYIGFLKEHDVVTANDQGSCVGTGETQTGFHITCLVPY